MEKYKSWHFSPRNNRSMLMPRIPKGEACHPGNRLRLSFEPVLEEKLDKEHPYFQQNTGFYRKNMELEGKIREYAVYVPEGMTSKGAAAVIFPDSGVKADDFLSMSNWRELSETYRIAYIILESEAWDKEHVEQDFDYAWKAVELEYGERLTADICEAWIYPVGLGDGACTATAFALTYSATFAAFAADGDCSVDPELLETLRGLPSDGIDTVKKTEIPIPGFLIDRGGRAEETFAYIKETIRAKEDGLLNAYGSVYLEKPRPGAYFVNDQPVAQVWLGDPERIRYAGREILNEEMIKFILRFSRWGGFGNNHLCRKQSPEEIGVIRIQKEIEGLPRYWDVFVPSCYRPEDGREYPLVVAIHGFSCNSEYFEQTSDWYRLAEEREFIVAFASAYPRNVGRSRFPLPGWCVWPMEEENIDETVYFRELLDHMETSWHIDKKRIYAAGHSNGGRMVQKLSRAMPERFAAFGPAGALGGSTADSIEPIGDRISCPVWFMMGEYDLASPFVEEGSVAKATLEAYCKANRMEPQFDNWFDNGNYHTLVMYDENHVPMIRYTIIRGCPHTYTGEMAQMVWDQFFCHYTREPDGSARYHG